jgi:large subunit ribosomal protein L18
MTDSRYCVPFRRRKSGKTNFHKRKALILSLKPRLVTRTTISNAQAQIIVAKPKGDEVLVSAHSKELTKNYGWKAPEGNLSAAYLTGFLCGSKAANNGITEAILDIGLHSPTKGARVFAMLRGALDAGVEVPHGNEKMPDEKRITGEHIARYAKELSSTPEIYQAKFSNYIKMKLPPEELKKHFAEVKEGISAAYKSGGKKT